MNTLYGRTLRHTVAVLLFFAAIGLSAQSEARPSDPTWQPPIVVKPVPKSDCDVVLERVTYGRGGYVVAGTRGPCLKSESEKRPVRWVGPRGTVPIYE